MNKKKEYKPKKTEIITKDEYEEVVVEDEHGNLQGIITARILTRNLLKLMRDPGDKALVVEDIMVKEPIVIHPEASIIDAMKVMRKNNIGCLPVVENNKLVGVITETDFLDITSSLLERLHLKRQKSNK